VTTVHQFVPSYTGRTAIGAHTTEVTRTLRSMGLRTHTFVGEARDVPKGSTSPYRSFTGTAPGEPTWLLYQLSTGSPMADFLAVRSEPLLVNYHNVTPSRFVVPWEPLIAPEMDEGRHQMSRLARRTELGIAVSGYNEAELKAAGYPHTTVSPVLVDLEALAAEGDPGTAARLAAAKRDGGADWLFVGRLNPNKCQHQIIKALAAYRRLYDPKARLWLVGASSSHAYRAALEGFVNELGLGAAVILTGSIPQPALVEHYRHADVMVCLSEHEGFCIPLLEAMWHRVPIVALASSAVPETLAGSGLLLPPDSRGRQPSPAAVAAAVHKLLGAGGDLRDRLVEAGLKRVEDFSLARSRARFCETISGVVGATT
jgi:glycosyltransferase involved in cell wall biosynthesis